MLVIDPNKLKGSVQIPSSKSMGHRAVICAALAKGISIIDKVDLSDDIIVTIEGMRALGASIEVQGNKLIVDGTHTGHVKEAFIDCNESGSTLRFLVPLSLATYKKAHFVGRGQLGKRPLKTFYDIFDTQQIAYQFTQDVLDLHVEGQMQSGTFHLPGNISSQFISGLLFTLPLLEGDSTIYITTEMESKGYIDLTLQMLEKFGIEIEHVDYTCFNIKGNQQYKPAHYTVEGDYSQAAFFLVAAALGNEVISGNVEPLSLQGDKMCIDLLEEMGCTVTFSDNNELSVKADGLKGITVDAKQCPDIIPVMTVLLAVSEGESRIINGSRLRIKECDRLHAIATELNKLGADIVEHEESLTIRGVKTLKGGQVHSHHDHRIAMSMAIAATVCKEPVEIIAPECVSKSYPHFFEDYSKLGGKYIR